MLEFKCSYVDDIQIEKLDERINGEVKIIYSKYEIKRQSICYRNVSHSGLPFGELPFMIIRVNVAISILGSIFDNEKIVGYI